MDMKAGRRREALEIVRYKKAALVGRLMLGELDGPMESISVEQFVDKPRKELISERDALRASLRGEIAKFCRNNFVRVEPEDLVKLYDVLFEHRSEWFLPLTEFEREFGRLKPGALKGAPLHCTVRLSPWGLQTEFPEHHLIRDLAVTLNEAIEIEEHSLTPYRTKSWQQQKEQSTRPEIADLIRRRNANLRASVLSCFNLIEAYVNGLAWNYVQTHDISGMTEKNRNVLTESEKFVNIIDKLIKIPVLTTGREPGPLHQTRDPLKSFIEIVKPHRDAIVHASPFAAAQKFGGYDKLSKLYDLSLGTVRTAVEVTITLIKTLHQFVDGTSELPPWFLARDAEGRFIVLTDK
jgi:hypothetical protein